LEYDIAGDKAAGRQAVAWVLGPASDLRQQAIVFDWCQDLLSESQKKELAGRMLRGISATAEDDSLAAVRSRVLAAVALFDEVPDVPQQELNRIVYTWWRNRFVPELKAGRTALRPDEAYPLYELLHALRDSTNIDLREAWPAHFEQYPIEHVLS